MSKSIRPDAAGNISDMCRRAFGAPPEDLFIPLKSASDALNQLYEIFRTISDEALDTKTVAGYRIKALADAGAYLAFDVAQFAGCEYERMLDSLIASGVLRKEIANG